MNDRDQSWETFDLSDDAQRAAREFTDHVKSELVLRAQLYAESRGSRSIERRDIYKASREFSLPAGPPLETSRKRLLFIAGASGLAVSILLGVTLFIGGLDQADRLSAVMGAATGALGLIVSVSVLIKGRTAGKPLHDETPSDIQADSRELIAVWEDIERVIRDDEPDVITTRRPSLGQLLEDFSLRHNLDEKFMEEVRKVVSVRNDLAHGRGAIPPEKIAGHLRQAQRMALTVREIANRSRDNS